MSSLVAPLPMLVVCDVLGVPAADHDEFYGWLEGINSVVSYGLVEARIPSRRCGTTWPSSWWPSGRTRRRPAVRLVGEQGDAAADGRGAGRAGRRGAGRRHRDQLHRHRAAGAVPASRSSWPNCARTRRSWAPVTADEMLRYTTVSAMFRVVMVADDIELSGVPSGRRLLMALPWSAIAIPSVFPDPNVFDIDRCCRPRT